MQKSPHKLFGSLMITALMALVIGSSLKIKTAEAGDDPVQDCLNNCLTGFKTCLSLADIFCHWFYPTDIVLEDECYAAGEAGCEGLADQCAERCFPKPKPPRIDPLPPIGPEDPPMLCDEESRRLSLC